MLGVGGGNRDRRSGRFDSERVGLGGGSPAMQNGSGSGARAADVVKSMGVGLCSGVVILTSLSEDIRRQGNFLHLSTPSRSARLHTAALRNYSLIFSVKPWNWFEKQN